MILAQIYHKALIAVADVSTSATFVWGHGNMAFFASTSRLAGKIRAGYAYGSLEGGSGCGSGERRGTSDCRFEKACPCQFV